MTTDKVGTPRTEAKTILSKGSAVAMVDRCLGRCCSGGNHRDAVPPIRIYGAACLLLGSLNLFVPEAYEGLRDFLRAKFRPHNKPQASCLERARVDILVAPAQCRSAAAARAV